VNQGDASRGVVNGIFNTAVRQCSDGFARC
jgi:hypothetical protein